MRPFGKVKTWLAGAVLAGFCAVAAAQAPVEVPFFYPVAVGGPITKIIDRFAADFEKDNPGIKLRPIYSGSYQESIAKATSSCVSMAWILVSMPIRPVRRWRLAARSSSAFVRSISSSRSSGACARASTTSNTWAAIRS